MDEQQFRPRGFSLLPTVVKNLLIINVLVFLAQLVVESRFHIRLEDYLGLHYIGSQKFEPWQYVTYMFLHGGWSHIFLNMFALWMFGYAIENIWGPKRFLVYYFITGIGAALVHTLVIYFEITPTITAINHLISDPSSQALFDFFSNHKLEIGQYSGDIYAESIKMQESLDILGTNPDNRQALHNAINFMVDYKEYYLNLPNVIGASGAVFGILLAFGMLFPNMLVYIYFLVPVKAKYFVIFYGAVELIDGLTGASANVAHFAHLGGMIFGFFLIMYWKRKGKLY
jgi:membrane associated rhomboid family serine protease